jgi:hypothetical protein
LVEGLAVHTGCAEEGLRLENLGEEKHEKHENDYSPGGFVRQDLRDFGLFWDLQFFVFF